MLWIDAKLPGSPALVTGVDVIALVPAQGLAVHGKYQEECRRCGTTIQRIKYASNETDYCPNCQTGGKLLADRALSRLLREDWPKTPEEMELRKLTKRALLEST